MVTASPPPNMGVKPGIRVNVEDTAAVGLTGADNDAVTLATVLAEVAVETGFVLAGCSGSDVFVEISVAAAVSVGDAVGEKAGLLV